MPLKFIYHFYLASIKLKRTGRPWFCFLRLSPTLQQGSHPSLAKTHVKVWSPHVRCWPRTGDLQVAQWPVIGRFTPSLSTLDRLSICTCTDLSWHHSSQWSKLLLHCLTPLSICMLDPNRSQTIRILHTSTVKFEQHYFHFLYWYKNVSSLGVLYMLTEIKDTW